MHTFADKLNRLFLDRRSGSSTIATRFCRLCQAELHTSKRPVKPPDIANALAKLIEAFPTMALLRSLADRLRPGKVARLSAGRQEDTMLVSRRLEEFLEELAANRRHAARVFADAAAADCRSVLTLSASGAVLEACTALNARRLQMRPRRRTPLSVVVCESRPACEGVSMARNLTRAGCDATVITDASMGSWIEKVDAVVLGADWIDRRGFVNKTGSLAASRLSAALRKPAFVVGDSLRFRRTALPYSQIPRLPGSSSSGPRTESTLFERVAWVRTHVLVTELGVFHPAACDFRLFRS